LLKILFANPPFLGRFSRSQRSPGVIKSGTMYYPYWLAHAAAVAEKYGHEIHLLDCPAGAKSKEDMAQKVREFQPHLIVMESVTASWNNDLQIAAYIKNTYAETKICLTGTHVTSMWHETLQREPAVDFVAIGEFDYTIRDLADELQRKRQRLHKVMGLAYRRKKHIIRNTERPLIQNLDELPWIAPIYKRFLNVKDYYFNLSFYPMIMLIGGRGCTAMCFYCVYPQVMHGHRYRHRSPQHIIDEILWVQHNMAEIKEITFEDDNFAADKKFARTFADLAIEQGVHLPFFANLRTTVDFETLRSLKKAGLRNTAVGFESGDDRILKNMRKGQNTLIQKKFVQNAHSLGLLVHGCFMVGFPGETRRTMEKTLDLAFSIKPDSAQFYPVMPYPGTGAFAYYQKRGYLLSENFSDWLTDQGGHQNVLNLPGLPAEEIEQFCEYASRAFHFRPRYLFYKFLQAVKNPKEGYRSIQAALYFIRSLFLARKKIKKQITRIPPEPDSEWQSYIRVPMGRMEKIMKNLP
jgi:anaerobic magnesium-protoporphyrin IX monomethyl ester cyclase